MGYISWKCAVSKESIAVTAAGYSPFQSACYLITPDQTFFEPAYNGYGQIDGKSIYDLTRNCEIKLVLAKYYDGQSYWELLKSEECEYQGFFYENKWSIIQSLS